MSLESKDFHMSGGSDGARCRQPGPRKQTAFLYEQSVSFQEMDNAEEAIEELPGIPVFPFRMHACRTVLFQFACSKIDVART